MAKPPSKEGAVAPTERINIKYRDETGGVTEDVELPLRMLVLGDFKGRADTSDAPDFVPLEDRKPINIDKNNFDAVLESQNVTLELNGIKNVINPESKGEEMSVRLDFKSMKDFEPEQVVEHIEPLNELLELRKALTELKGPLAQNAAFRKQLQALLDDESERKSILDEIDFSPSQS